MIINLRKCNFSKLINFITSINDGELHNASIDNIVDRIYDDTWRYNDEMANTTYSSYDDIAMIILEAMEDDTSYNTNVHIYYDNNYSDCEI